MHSRCPAFGKAVEIPVARPLHASEDITKPAGFPIPVEKQQTEVLTGAKKIKKELLQLN